MIEQNIPAAAAEQARLDLSLAAGMEERANHPKLPLYGAIALLVIATIYAVVSFSSRQSAIAAADKARGQADEVIKLVNEVKQLQKTLAERGLDPNPRIASEIEALAHLNNAQLSGVVSDSTGPITSAAGTINKFYKARFESQPAAALLGFLNLVLEDNKQTAGVGIWNLEFTPGVPDAVTGQTGWNLNVDFVRSERQPKR